jgi:hypothetical protein
MPDEDNLGTLFVVEVTHKGGKKTRHGTRTNNPVTEDWVAHHLAELGIHGEDAEHIHVKLSTSEVPAKLEDLVKQKPKIAPTISTHKNPEPRQTPQTRKRVEQHEEASVALKTQQDAERAARESAEAAVKVGNAPAAEGRAADSPAPLEEHTDATSYRDKKGKKVLTATHPHTDPEAGLPKPSDE